MARLFFVIVALVFSSALAQPRACDIYASAGTPCVAASSTTRKLYEDYSGPLYEVTRLADNATLNISALESGFADSGAQDAFCNTTSSNSTMPPLGSMVSLIPSGLSSLSFRHCSAQGYVTPSPPSPVDDHYFTLVAALNGDENAVSFRSVNFPSYYIAPIAGAEPGRVGVVEAPAADDATWVVTPAPASEGAFYFACSGRGGHMLTVGSNLTGLCSADYAPPAASVYIDASASPTAWALSTGGSGACVISRLFDQSAQGNHLTPGPGGGAEPVPDKPVFAQSFPVTLAGGHKVYGAYFQTKMGYRRDDTTGVARGDDAETIYAVWSGKIHNDGCCADWGNGEVNNHDDGAGTMECVYYGSWNATKSGWCGGSGSGPWVMADLENGLWAGSCRGGINPNVTTQRAEYVTGLVKGKPGLWAIKAGNATGGPLVKSYEGPRPAGYAPMKKQGAIILGIGGDNSNSAISVWFEGVMTSGYSDDATDDAVQQDIVSVYGSA